VRGAYQMHIFLYMIIFFEGFIVLATELIAIRQMLPVAGAGTDVIAIVIAAVLMPLAFGYFVGGQYKVQDTKNLKNEIRKKLSQNFFIAASFLAFALSQIFVEFLFELFQLVGIFDRLIQVSLYAIGFLVVPIYLLGKTIPLIVNLFKAETLPKLTGYILWCSTMGSFLGAILTSLILMAYWGVNNTTILIVMSLLILSILLKPPERIKQGGAVVFVVCLVWVFNGSYMMSFLDVVYDGAYNNVKVYSDKNTRVLALNNNFSGALDAEGVIPPYMKFIEKSFIEPIRDVNNAKKNILVLGSGGFTLGISELHNTYVFVDIDKALLPLSEKYILQQKLDENKKFVALPARRYLKQAQANKEKFDLIVVDMFKGKSTPEQLVTREFFASLKNILSDDGRLIMNTLSCPNYSDSFSVHLDQTIRSVFAGINTHIQTPKAYNAWERYDRDKKTRYCDAQVLYIYINSPLRNNVVYSDNKNQVFADY